MKIVNIENKCKFGIITKLELIETRSTLINCYRVLTRKFVFNNSGRCPVRSWGKRNSDGQNRWRSKRDTTRVSLVGQHHEKRWPLLRWYYTQFKIHSHRRSLFVLVSKHFFNFSFKCMLVRYSKLLGYTHHLFFFIEI